MEAQGVLGMIPGEPEAISRESLEGPTECDLYSIQMNHQVNLKLNSDKIGWHFSINALQSNN